jgi:hypothetical protein
LSRSFVGVAEPGEDLAGFVLTLLDALLFIAGGGLDVGIRRGFLHFAPHPITRTSRVLGAPVALRSG